VSSTVAPYRWSVSEFLRAWEAGAFDHRVELIEGEVWPVVIGDWHGEMVFRVARCLPTEGVLITSSTLPSGNSLPDPDCWVRRQKAQPAGELGTRGLSLWRPADVLLVVEISDDTVVADLNIKARIYGSAGYLVYWVVTADVIFEHTEPTPAGYRVRREYRRGDQLPVPYAGTEIAVDELLGPQN
jgi:Putative restriction endonuclease